jgi:Kdo2-lipid IVA lauroyltransferase/acyltransferase
MTDVTDRLALRMLYVLAGAAAWFAYRLLGLRRRVIRGNLARSFPQWPRERQRAVEREFVRRQGEFMAELLYTPRIGADEMRARVVLANPQLLAEAAPGHPVVLVGAHHCNSEWAMQRVSLEFGARLVGLYKPIRNARLDGWFRQLRSRFGSRLVPAKSVLRELARSRDVAVIGLIADQSPTTSPEKHWTEFLGQDTAFYMGPELLARALRGQVVLGRMRRLARGRYEMTFEALNAPGERLPHGELTGRYARALEAWIGDDPAGWWWSHQRWKLQRQVY